MTQTQAPETQLIDPLLHDFEMPLEATYYPLGFPVRIATNCSDILLAAEESWGRFREMHAVPAAHMRIGILDGGPSECPGDPVVREQRSLRARVSDAENFAYSDLRNRFAFAWLTRATVVNRPYLRWHYIEGISWDLLETYLTPVHGGCVRFEGKGVLICGDSGAGKSSLTYACGAVGRSWPTIPQISFVVERARTLSVIPTRFAFANRRLDFSPSSLRRRSLPA
jgi:hypothetical protein